MCNVCHIRNKCYHPHDYEHCTNTSQTTFNDIGIYHSTNMAATLHL